jgi:uncharacterized protein (TIGR00645 family)
MKKVETFLEKIIFFSRWFQLPIYLGLILGGLIYLYKFFSELLYLIWNIFNLSSNQILFGILTLIDISLVSNLLIMVIIGGYSTFVSKIDFNNDEDKPGWVDKIDDGAIKLKLSMSIVIIAAIDLLRTFIDVEHINPEHIKLQLIIFGVFLITVMVFVITKKLYYTKGHE